jgi:hypothetical protein
MTPLEQLTEALEAWLARERDSLNTLAGAIVVLDMLHRKLPLTEADVFTQGGQIVGARGLALRQTLERYGIDRRFLSDGVTTRSTNKFIGLLRAIENGQALLPLLPDARQHTINALIAILSARISTRTQRTAVEIDTGSRVSLVARVRQILQETRDRSRGRVEQHLIGAKLTRRFPGQTINRERTYAADMQTERTGDFIIQNSVYHVTASPADPLIYKARLNLSGGLQPIFIVPRALLLRALELATLAGIAEQVMIFGLEDFLAQNLLEMADADGIDHEAMFESIIDLYNARIAEIETDQSLQIRLRRDDLIDSLSENMLPDPRD